MKQLLLRLTCVSLVMLLSGRAHGQYGGMTLDHMDGVFSGDTVLCGQQVGWHIRLTNASNCNIRGMTNGFRVWMVGGGVRSPITWGIHEQDPTWDYMFSLTAGLVESPFSVDGTGSDTIGFGGAGIFGPGIAAGFDEEVWHIFTTPQTDGDTLCIDSCFIPTGNPWIWAMDNPCTTYVPTWDGPHCFVVRECCMGIRGNVDGLAGIDIADLIYLVEYLFFSGPAPQCEEEGDVDGDGGINVVDVIYLVDYLFFDGPPPAPCP